MDLTTFNTCSPQHARAVVRSAAAIESWAEAVVAGRPYRDLDDLIEQADALAGRWTDRELAPLRSTATCVAIRPTHRWLTETTGTTPADDPDEVSETVLLRCRSRELALLRLQQAFDPIDAHPARRGEVGHARSA